MSINEPKLFGQPKYEVERLADTLREAEEAKNTKPDLYEAALKLTKKRQIALGAVLKAAGSKRGN